MGALYIQVLVFLLGGNMKRLIMLFIVIFSILPLSAGDCFDVSLSVGQQSYKWPERGISLSYGLNVGLARRLELDMWGVSEIVPMPFASNMFGIELAYAIMGDRSTASKVAGSGINMLVSIGGFYRTDNNGAGPMLSITPLSVGSPISGRRERILKTGIGYDAVNNELVVAFSLISIDFYVRGSWRDYSF